MRVNRRTSRPRSRWAVALLAIAVVGVVATLVLVRSGSSQSNALQVSFDPDDPPAPLADRVEGNWTMEGEWSVEDGTARVTTQGDQSFATLNTTSPDEDVRVVFETTAGGGGIAFRYSDTQNFWSAWAAESYGSWVVYRTVDGHSEQIAQAPWSLTTGPTAVEVRLDGRTIRVLVDEKQVVALIDPGGAVDSGQRAGFYSTGSDHALDARWAELVVGEFDE